MRNRRVNHCSSSFLDAAAGYKANSESTDQQAVTEPTSPTNGAGLHGTSYSKSNRKERGPSLNQLSGLFMPSSSIRGGTWRPTRPAITPYTAATSLVSLFDMKRVEPNQQFPNPTMTCQSRQEPMPIENCPRYSSQPLTLMIRLDLRPFHFRRQLLLSNLPVRMNKHFARPCA